MCLPGLLFEREQPKIWVCESVVVKQDFFQRISEAKVWASQNQHKKSEMQAWPCDDPCNFISGRLADGLCGIFLEEEHLFGLYTSCMLHPGHAKEPSVQEAIEVLVLWKNVLKTWRSIVQLLFWWWWWWWSSSFFCKQHVIGKEQRLAFCDRHVKKRSKSPSGKGKEILVSRVVFCIVFSQQPASTEPLSQGQPSMSRRLA